MPLLENKGTKPVLGIQTNIFRGNNGTSQSIPRGQISNRYPLGGPRNLSSQTIITKSQATSPRQKKQQQKTKQKKKQQQKKQQHDITYSSTAVVSVGLMDNDVTSA